MGIIIGIVVLAVIAGIVVVAMKGKSSGTSGEQTASTAEAIARVAPQTAPKPSPTLSIPKPEAEPAPRPTSFVDDPVPFTKPSASLPRLGLEPSGAAVPAPAAEAAPAPAAVAAADAPFDTSVDGHDGHDEEHDDDAGFDRFGAPGQRAKLTDDELLSKPLWEVAGGAVASGTDTDPAFDEAEAPATTDDAFAHDDGFAHDAPPEGAAVVSAAMVDEAEERFDPSALVIEEPELVPSVPASADGEPVVDLTVASDEPGPEAHDAVVEPEPVAYDAPVDAPADGAAEADAAVADVPVAPTAKADPVDHVLNALINRAKERQVGIAQVAAELVEQADLEDKEVDEVLADLLGVAESEGADAVDRPELTLFSDAVPQRPGQLTDFARLPSTEKKRALIRVLCLLVALQEEHKLDGRDADEATDDEDAAQTEEPAGARSWPLARAVWPVKTPQRRDDERDLPGRSRLAKTR